jgi:hypothetical protein
VVDAEPVRALLAVDAMKESTVDKFILGQADNGKTCDLSLRTAVHVGIIGASGCGKTASTGFQLALTALSRGYRVIILDGKCGMDWTPFDTVAERHDTDRHSFLPQMEAVHQEYEQRLDIAKRYQVRHISELRTADYPPVLVIVEEYGDLARLTPRAQMTRIEGMLDSLGAKGRAADVHFCLIDQYPEMWSQTVMGATKAKILYQMGPGQGAKVGDYYVQDLPDYGKFRYRQVPYNAWHVAPELPTYINVVQRAQLAGKIQRYPMLIDGSATVRNDNRTDRTADSKRTPPQEGADSGQREYQTPNTPPLPSAPDSGQSADTLTEKQREVIEYLRANPNVSLRDAELDLGISKTYIGDLRRMFAEEINRG